MAKVTLGSYTQYGDVMDSQKPALGKTHAMTEPYGAYNLSIKYPFTVDADCNKITFSLSFSGIPTPTSVPGVYEASSLSDAINIVKNNSFIYGIGTASGQTSYNTFKWNVTASSTAANVTGTKSSLVIRGNFYKGTTYYLWLSTNSRNICYVCKVKINSIEGSGAVQSKVTTFNPTTKEQYIGTTLQSYYNGFVGVEFRTDALRYWGLRFKITPSANLSKIDATFNFSEVQGSISNGFYAGISSSNTNEYPTSKVKVTCNGSSGSVSITQSFTAGKSYYLWIWGYDTTQYNIGVIKDVSNVSIVGTKQTYKITFPTNAGYTLEAINGSNASAVVYGDSFYFAINLKSGYIEKNLTIKAGSELLGINGNVLIIESVTANTTISVSGVILGGIIYISNGSSFDAYQVYIANGSGWDHYMPYVANGSSFDLYT